MIELVGGASDIAATVYVRQLRADGDRLVSAARTVPRAPVPTCPGWDTSILLAHVAAVHDWMAQIVATRSEDRPPERQPERLPVEFDALVVAYERGLERLIGELMAIRPDELVWNWWDRRPAPARFWFRRAAQETVVHRVDAEVAAGLASPVESALAADGIDEYLGIVAHVLTRHRLEGLAGRFSFEATDVGSAWHVEVAPDRLVSVEATSPDTTVSGSASDLYLWLVHREGPGTAGVEIDGDLDAAKVWELFRFE